MYCILNIPYMGCISTYVIMCIRYSKAAIQFNLLVGIRHHIIHKLITYTPIQHITHNTACEHVLDKYYTIITYIYILWGFMLHSWIHCNTHRSNVKHRVIVYITLLCNCIYVQCIIRNMKSGNIKSRSSVFFQNFIPYCA